MWLKERGQVTRAAVPLTRGFAFIALEAGGKDCVVHQSAVQAEGFRTLAEGDRVEFDVVQGDKGPAAQNVVKQN